MSRWVSATIAPCSRCRPSHDLAVSIDTLAAGIHFFPDCDPEHVGHKSLAVGLSDLAAMGAEPAWATLALTLPAADEAWVRGFARRLRRSLRTRTASDWSAVIPRADL